MYVHFWVVYHLLLLETAFFKLLNFMYKQVLRPRQVSIMRSVL